MALPTPDSHPPDPTTKKPFNYTIVILVGVLGIGACLVVLVAGAFLLYPRVLSALSGLAPDTPVPEATLPAATIPVEPSPFPTNTPVPTNAPLPTDTLEPSPQPTETPPPTPTLEPPSPTPTEPPTADSGGYSSAFFEDDFSTTDKGWVEVSDDVKDIGYHEGGTYYLGVKEPEYYVWVYPPLDFPDDGALSDTYVSFSARLLTEDGYFGVFCRYQDDDNTYEIAIRDGAYSIGKWVDGDYSQLTSPEWIDTPYTGDEYSQGFPQFYVGCLGDTISLEINGYGVDPVYDDTFTEGGLAVFAVSGETFDEYEGYYAKLLLDTFTASIP